MLDKIYSSHLNFRRRCNAYSRPHLHSVNSGAHFPVRLAENPIARSIHWKLSKNLNGFTLIEICIVLLIIGIISSVAVVSFGDFGGTRRVVVFAEDSLSYLKAMQHQALIESIPFGIYITPRNFQTYRLNEELCWYSTSSPLFRAPHFPTNITVKLQSNLKNTAKYPGIVIDNSGEITPFQLKLGTSQNPELVTIINDSQGGLRLCKSASL